MTFAKEAVPFVAPFLVLAALAGWAGRPYAALSAFIIGCAVLLFFRIPARPDSAPAGAVLAPANGRVTRIDRVMLPEFEGEEFQRIATFLSVFDIHVQRSPVAAEVVGSFYTQGRKVAAFREEADRVNQNQLTLLRTESGDRLAVRQISGLVARRVVSHVDTGDRLQRGELFGLIKFGSRVDLMLPLDYAIGVEVGDRVVEGATVVASAPSD